MLNEVNIRCFLSLAQTKNFTKTAKSLYMSQQAVSQNIAKLESTLGFPLFTRTKHYVALTHAGQQYYNFFSSISEKYQELYEKCQHQYNSSKEVFKVGYQNWTKANQALESLEEKFPGLLLDITKRSPGQLVRMLDNNEVNMIIVYGRFIQPSAHRRFLKLCELDLEVLVSADNPKATTKASYRDFEDLPYIIDSLENESDEQIQMRLRQEIDLLGISPNNIIIVPNRDAAYEACERGEGFLLTTSASQVHKKRNLKKIPTGLLETLVCVWSTNDDNVAIEQYAKILRKAFEDISVE